MCSVVVVASPGVDHLDQDVDLEAVRCSRRGMRRAIRARGGLSGYSSSAGSPPSLRRSLRARRRVAAVKPNVILAQSALALTPIQRATETIPIVFVQVFDPVGSGFVASLARPGGNTTGFADAEFSMSGKLLEVLKEIAPHLRRVAVIHNPVQAPQIAMWHAIEAVAPSLGVVVSAVAPRDGAEIEHTIEVSRNEPGSGVIVLPNPITNLHRELLIALMARHRLPAVYAYPYFVSDGGLVSYGVDPAGQFRQAALYVDHILKGAKPADLPVQQPTKFQLAINLKTAKALGLKIPPSLLARADEVIE
jgi:putative ABC transport system substrate-binding protein